MGDRTSERSGREQIVNGIFDGTFNGMGAGQMYRAWVVPDLYPEERQPRLENWPAEDLEAYCGIGIKL